jgi:putative effector of murein hydrolase LrgA (UPF0299 family)
MVHLVMSAGLVKLQWAERTANLLLRHMVLLFVLLTVGLMNMGAGRIAFLPSSAEP